MPRPRLRLSEQQRRDLTVRQGELTALSQHTAWPVLRAEVDNKAERIEKHVLAITLGSRGQIPVDEINYWRGFIQGMRWFAAVPEGAENRLEQFLRQQGVEAQ